MSMLLNPYRFASGSSSALLLDETGLGSAHAAYSVARKLRSAYSGSAIRVRRSSDDAEQDIGFSSDVLDESALTTFVGANDGYVVTIYDQSGNARDVAQSTSADQGRIVNSGTVIKDNGQPALEPDDNEGYVYSGGAISAQTEVTFSAVAHSGSSDGVNYTKGIAQFGTASNGAGVFLQYGYYNQSSLARKPLINAWSAIYTTSAASASENTNQVALVGIQNSSAVKLYEDDETAVTNTSTYSLSVTNNAMYVAAQATSKELESDGFLQEVVIWTSDLDAYVSTIKSNVNGFYSIY